MKLSPRLPDEEHNGLSRLEGRMVRQPDEHHLVVGVVDVYRTTRDHDTGDIAVTARLRHVEVMREDEHESVAQDLLDRVHALRTGLNPLPFGKGAE